MPVTVKLRSGLERGDRSGLELAQRLVEEGAAAIAFHPRPAAVGHKGRPDYDLARELVESVDVPVVITGGLSSAEAAQGAYRRSGADAVMIARGALGYPWVFEELLGTRRRPPGEEEILAELHWVVDRAEEHLGADRACRYLRKFYPWYLERLEADSEIAGQLQRSGDLASARRLLAAIGGRAGVAA